MACLSLVNTVAADDLGMPGDRSLAAMLLNLHGCV